MLDGKLPVGWNMNDKPYASHPQMIKNPSPAESIHCVVFVVASYEAKGGTNYELFKRFLDGAAARSTFLMFLMYSRN